MIECLDYMLETQEYQNYASETVYSLQDHCINNDYDTDADTMDEYNEAGMFGVTHNDIISNYRHYLNSNHKEIIGECDCITELAELCICCNTFNFITEEINKLEEWHIENGSIDEII